MDENQNTRFLPSDLKVIDRRTAYDGYFRMDEWHLRHKLYDGGWSREFTRECLERGHAVAVLPYDPVRDEVVLIEQFRVGALASESSPNWTEAPYPWLIEIVAGIVEDGETVEDVAIRETQEEAGCDVTALEPITTLLVTPGCSSETISIYLGRVDSSNAGGIHGLDHENEDIRVFTVSSSDAFQMVTDGRINNGTSIIALQWLQLNHERLLKTQSL